MDIDPDQHVGQALPGRPQTLQSLAVTMPGAEDAAPEDAKDSALDAARCSAPKTHSPTFLSELCLVARRQSKPRPHSKTRLSCGPVVERQEPATDVWLSLAASVSELGSYIPGRECFLKPTKGHGGACGECHAATEGQVGKTLSASQRCRTERRQDWALRLQQIR